MSARRSLLQAHYGVAQRLLEMVAIVLFVASVCCDLWQLSSWARAHALSAVQLTGLVAGIGILALLCADFASGFVHWAADNWGSADMPFFGPGFIQPFRQHHVDASEIAEHDFIELNGNNCLVSLPLLGACWALAHSDSAWGFAGGVFCLALAIWVLATNQFHAWAHAARVPRPVAALQRAGMILSPNHHAVHHASPHNRHYCITTGWLNAPLEQLRFFERLERQVARWTGVVARHAQGGKAQAGRPSQQ